MADALTTAGHGLTRYKHGRCRCPVCSQANRDWQARRARLTAYGQWDGLADATGTRRRLQALMRNGWSLGLLSARLGCARQELRIKLHDRSTATVATACAVRALYDELWDQQPPEGNRFERRAATMARRYAAGRGWPPPLAWDDDSIDDPAASPADGWERRDGVRGYGVLAADAADLLGFGETPAHVAERLGVSENTLKASLMRARKREEGRRAA